MNPATERRDAADRALALASRHAAAAIIAAWAAIFAWGYGRSDLAGADEGRYVLVARNLLRGESWWLLELGGETYDQKPPLPFWIWAASLSLSGGEVDSWLVRAPSILFALATLFLTAFVGQRLFGRRAGLLAALVLATSPSFARHAASARLDIMLAGWTTFAIAPWMIRDRDRPLPWGQALWLWGGLYGGMMTKGPPAALFILAPIVGEAAYRRSWRTLRDARPVAGLPLVLAGVAFWLAMEAREGGWDFVRRQVFGETVDRFAKGAHKAPAWFYPPEILGSLFMPWSIPLLIAAVQRARRWRQATPAVAALLGWIAIPLVVLSLAHGKRNSYALPMLPALALVVGQWLDRFIAAGTVDRRLSRAVGALWIVAGLASAGFALLLAAPPQWLVDKDIAGGGLDVALCLAAGAGLVGAGLWTLAFASPARLATGAFGAVAIVAAFLVAVAPKLREEVESARGLARFIEANLAREGAATVGGLRRARSGHLHVYGDYMCRAFEDEEKLLAASQPPDLLLVDERDWDHAVDAANKLGYRFLGSTVADGDDLGLYSRLPAKSD